ncbi:hypothetical protein [Micromonospora sp. WMMD737]|uniref:hypothetical protein n=1 Tax=Micromonospora sp. WMMD737 TaxID=3404113 RepID=UPI003B928624
MATGPITIERPDDEHIEIHVNGEVVASANHDEHGWSGMDAVERTALAVAGALSADPTSDRAQPFNPTPVEIRLHALNTAAAQRREVMSIKEDEDPGWLARATLADAKLYARWLESGAAEGAAAATADQTGLNEPGEKAEV